MDQSPLEHLVSKDGEAEIALRTSERLSALALASGQLGTWQLDVATQTALRTLRHDQIFGYAEGAKDWTYEVFLGHVIAQDRAMVDIRYRKALDEGLDWEFEARILRLDGQERWIWAKGKHFRNAAGAPVQIIGLVGDVTERKRAELAVRQNERLAAVGRLASTIAHEISNPLEAVTNLLYLARHSVEIGEIRGFLETAESELQRVSAITAQTLRFSKETTKVEKIAWSDLLGSVLAIFRGRLVNHGITVEQRFRSDQTVFGFAGEIRQVLNNLVGNAIDAMREGGRLLLRLHPVHHPLLETAGVVLTIADTGSGMNHDTVAKIFDPFFSTKGAMGNGLGLWVSQEIVRRHHGTLSVRSCKDPEHNGTVFRLFLPSGEMPEPQASVP